jgi:hypothetical protein
MPAGLGQQAAGVVEPARVDRGTGVVDRSLGGYHLGVLRVG